MHPKFPTSHDPFGIQSSNPFSVQSRPSQLQLP
uniref:Uncharacterized protein n=1 Tax=Cucumis melo TaxID=3656 RepID=A0A9I9E8X7_CUCME